MLIEKMFRPHRTALLIAEPGGVGSDDRAPLPLQGADRAMAFAGAGGEIEVDLILNLSAMTTAFVGYQH